MRQCRSVNFIWCRSVNFIWCQSLPSCMGGYVISTWFLIVWEPKNSICGYAECARANRTMAIYAILQTRVPLESWKNKESFYIEQSEKKKKKEKEKSRLSFWWLREGIVDIIGFIVVPCGFACVASPKMMSDCHMLRMNVCDAGMHAETRKRFDIYKSVCAYSMKNA